MLFKVCFINGERLVKIVTVYSRNRNEAYAKAEELYRRKWSFDYSDMYID